MTHNKLASAGKMCVYTSGGPRFFFFYHLFFGGWGEGGGAIILLKGHQCPKWNVGEFVINHKIEGYPGPTLDPQICTQVQTHTQSSFWGDGGGGEIVLAKGHQCPIMECWGVCYKL